MQNLSKIESGVKKIKSNFDRTERQESNKDQTSFHVLKTLLINLIKRTYSEYYLSFEKEWAKKFITLIKFDI
jgi:hypothetical protein